MKTAWLCFLCILCRPPLVGGQTSIDLIEPDIYYLTADSLFGPEAKAVQARIPEYRRRLSRADSLSRTGQYEIDLIGQWHLGNIPTDYELRQVRHSQRQVCHLLDSLRYDIVSAEGYEFGRLTINNAWAEAEEQVRRQQFFASDRTVDRHLEFKREYDGVLKYLWRHPRRRVVGSECQAMLAFGQRYYQLDADSVSSYGRRFGPAWDDLAVTIRIVRTELAIAAMIDELHRAGKRRGVIVLGIWHSYEWSELSGRYRLRSRYWPSIDLSKGQLEEARRIRERLAKP